MAWGDYNNDEKLDLLLMGAIGQGQKIAKVYINNGDGSFTDSDLKPSLPDLYDSAIAWGDYDNDKDLDAAISGKDKNGKKVTAIYRNDGNGVFEQNTAVFLPGVDNGSLAWGDYNNDGRLDLLLSGLAEDNRRISRIYINNGNDRFTNSYELLTGTDNGAATWGDYNKDAQLDILLTGATAEDEAIAQIYQNTLAADIPQDTLSKNIDINKSDIKSELSFQGAAQ